MGWASGGELRDRGSRQLVANRWAAQNEMGCSGHDSQRCPKCGSSELKTLAESSDETAFFECVGCGRHLAQSRGKSITERWLSPISLALYGAIYNRAEEHAKSCAEALARDQPDLIERVVAECKDELRVPSQRLVDMLPFAGRPSEQEVRRCLQVLVMRLDRVVGGDDG